LPSEKLDLFGAAAAGYRSGLLLEVAVDVNNAIITLDRNALYFNFL
jgi:hypothetical protein